MTLGRHFEFVLPKRDIAASLAFYQHHGFTPVEPSTPARVTDGQIVLAFDGQDGQPSRLRFFAGDGTDAVHGSYHDPNGVGFEIVSPAGAAPRLSGAPASEFGTFGEVSIETTALPASVAFWMALGFAPSAYSPQSPGSWESLTNGALLLGLYSAGSTKHRFANPVLTYFNEDMTWRLQRLKARGLATLQELPDAAGAPGHAVIEGPEGQMFYLFGF
jgi:predicted enzyme related to lactoylglutathione lyase